jgi:hypothetical protein
MRLCRLIFDSGTKNSAENTGYYSERRSDFRDSLVIRHSEFVISNIRVIRKRVASRNNANGEEINYSAFPRKHYWNPRRSSHADSNCRASVSDANFI